jgi:exodeoxyribonuclease V alpha subunit
MEVWGPQASFDAALARAVRRAGGLAARLAVATQTKGG